jgi:protein-S-isoprenylcysteine O-methyltransferase Ste14
MRFATPLVIWGCWAVWAVLWFVMAFSTKRTVERPDRPRVVVAVLVVAAGALALRVAQVQGDALHRRLWAPTTALDALSIVLVVGGLAVTAWARVTLGSNWSGSVVFKADHELIVTGPYALARHPIYTGLLAMLLGSAVASAQPLYLGAFVAALLVLYGKSRREEALMARHFPDAYPAYRRRVKALIPFVL